MNNKIKTEVFAVPETCDDSLDIESSSELLWVLNHFLLLEHRKILPLDIKIARLLRKKLENDDPFLHRDFVDALRLLNKLFDISDEFPEAVFRWNADDYLQLSIVLEEKVQANII